MQASICVRSIWVDCTLLSTDQQQMIHPETSRNQPGHEWFIRATFIIIVVVVIAFQFGPLMKIYSLFRRHPDQPPFCQRLCFINLAQSFTRKKVGVRIEYKDDTGDSIIHRGHISIILWIVEIFLTPTTYCLLVVCVLGASLPLWVCVHSSLSCALVRVLQQQVQIRQEHFIILVGFFSGGCAFPPIHPQFTFWAICNRIEGKLKMLLFVSFHSLAFCFFRWLLRIFCVSLKWKMCFAALWTHNVNALCACLSE